MIGLKAWPQYLLPPPIQRWNLFPHLSNLGWPCGRCASVCLSEFQSLDLKMSCSFYFHPLGTLLWDCHVSRSSLREDASPRGGDARCLSWQPTPIAKCESCLKPSIPAEYSCTMGPETTCRETTKPTHRIMRNNTSLLVCCGVLRAAISNRFKSTKIGATIQCF